MEKAIYRTAMQSSFFNDSSTSSGSNRSNEITAKVQRAVDSLSEDAHFLSNEPSLAFYRIQEHVRRTLPALVERKQEIKNIQKNIEGCYFDADYATSAVKSMQKSEGSFDKMENYLKNVLYYRQQIKYEQNRRRQRKKDVDEDSISIGGHVIISGSASGKLGRRSTDPRQKSKFPSSSLSVEDLSSKKLFHKNRSARSNSEKSRIRSSSLVLPFGGKSKVAASPAAKGQSDDGTRTDGSADGVEHTRSKNQTKLLSSMAGGQAVAASAPSTSAIVNTSSQAFAPPERLLFDRPTLLKSEAGGNATSLTAASDDGGDESRTRSASHS